MNRIILLCVGTPYIAIINDSGQWWNGTTFVAYNESNWADYVVTATQYGSTDTWYAVFPASIAAGYYDIIQFRRIGGTAAATDTVEANGSMFWSGSDLLAIGSEEAGVIDTVLSDEHGDSSWESGEAAAAEAIVAEMDANSTKLAAIAAQTSKIQFTDDNLVRARNDLVLGLVYVDHDYGGTDALKVVDTEGVAEADTTIRAYLTTNWDGGNRSADYLLGEDETDADGHWLRGMYLPTGDITLVFIKTGHYLKTVEITVAAA
jgi:hypothetical protein